MNAVRPFPGVAHMETREDEHDRTLIVGEYDNGVWSLPRYQELGFPTMEGSAPDTYYRLRGLQSCMGPSSEDCSMIDAPHAWRTSHVDYTGRNDYSHQRPYGLEIPQGKAPGEHWPSTEQDTSCSGGDSWTPHTSDSRSEADGTFNNQPTWNEDTRGHNLCLAHAGGPAYIHEFSVSPQELQQYPETCAEDNRAKPEMRAKEAGHTYYPENTGLCTPDQESSDYAQDDDPMGAPTQKRTSIASVKDEDEDESMDNDAEHDDDDDGEYTPATAGHGPGRGVARSSFTAKKAGLPTKRSQRSKGPAFPAQSPNKIAKKHAKTQVPSPSSTRNHTPCSHCQSHFPSDSTLKKHVLSTHTRPFICTFQRYGCNATVGSKNEWKRHINVQHLHLETWRCDLDACAFPGKPASGPSGQEKQPNCTSSSAVSASPGKKANSGEVQHHDFDRKDLFTQHIKRMHVPPPSASQAAKTDFETRIPEIQERCHRQLRSPPPRSRCIYCPDKVFEGPGSWTDRLEHVGKHLEKNDMKKEDEIEDEDLREWMMQQGFMEFTTPTGYKVTNADGKKKKNKSVVATSTSEGEEDAEGEDE